MNPYNFSKGIPETEVAIKLYTVRQYLTPLLSKLSTQGILSSPRASNPSTQASLSRADACLTVSLHLGV